MLKDNLFNLNQFEIFFNSLLIVNIKLFKLLSLKICWCHLQKSINSVIFNLLTISFIKKERYLKLILAEHHM